jgi:hypothetical protein
MVKKIWRIVCATVHHCRFDGVRPHISCIEYHSHCDMLLKSSTGTVRAKSVEAGRVGSAPVEGRIVRSHERF